MGFKPLRDSRPMPEREPSEQLEALFFSKLGHLSKKDQGRTMGAFRESISKFNFKVEVQNEP